MIFVWRCLQFEDEDEEEEDEVGEVVDETDDEEEGADEDGAGADIRTNAMDMDDGEEAAEVLLP